MTLFWGWKLALKMTPWKMAIFGICPIVNRGGWQPDFKGSVTLINGLRIRFFWVFPIGNTKIHYKNDGSGRYCDLKPKWSSLMSTLLFDSSFFLFSLSMQECLEELLHMYAMHFSGYEIWVQICACSSSSWEVSKKAHPHSTKQGQNSFVTQPSA